MSPFRLAIFQLDLYPMSPFARHVRNLAEEVGPDFQLDVLVVNDAGMEVAPNGVNVELLGGRPGGLSKRIPAHYRAIPDLIRYLQSAAVDAVVARGLSFGVPLTVAHRLSGRKVPIFMSLHAALDHERSNRSHRLAFAYGPMYRFVEKHARGILPVSEGVKLSYSPLAKNHDPVHVVNNPVFSMSLREMAEGTINHPWFSEKRSFLTALTVGRLAPEKEQHIQIEAISLLRAEGLDIRLVLLGDGPLRKELQDLVDRKGLGDSIQFLGRRDNPFPYMKRCDVFCLSSRYEGLPGVLVQAMALGCRIVSTDCVAGPREVLRNGQFGELVPVGDARALAGATKRVLRRRLGDRELKDEASLYSASRFVKRIISLV